MRLSLLILGIFGILFGGYNGWETSSFLKRSQLVEADVTGFSSFQKLDRVKGECSAYRKGCAAIVEFKLTTGEQAKDVLVSQPIFARATTNKIKLFVDPKDISNPRIASIHVLLRNATCSGFLGIICLFMSWVLKKKN